MTEKSYVIGIDLGTSNCALAYKESDADQIHQLDCDQLESPGKLTQQKILPSCIYIPHAGEVSEEELRLPWEKETSNTQSVIGMWARRRGSEISHRVINSAKSWLCNPFVDRREAILPWDSDVEQKMSPLVASTAYLKHLNANFKFKCQATSEQIAKTVITVPASFDEVARKLTLEASELAGLDNVTLLEEPQAAFYAWIAHNEKNWRNYIEAGDIVCVCDIGGGTTDFSLIVVGENNDELVLERISVGEHLLLGGDNMDLALAHQIAQKLEQEGKSLDHWQLQNLVHATREAKERMLSDSRIENYPISIASRGSKLFASTISAQISSEEIDQTILEGFFPKCAPNEMPTQSPSTGLFEFGLHYESDPAITRHLAKFLQQAKANVSSDPKLAKLLAKSKDFVLSHPNLLLPTAILFNGGVFNSERLRNRVRDTLNFWLADQAEIKELKSHHLDLAVSFGASYFADINAKGEGIRITAGSAYSYYLGLETPQLAIPGRKPQIKGICVVPQGTLEGTTLAVKGRPFGLVTGEPVEFRFFRSKIRPTDQLGSIVENATTELEETASLAITLPGKASELVPVNLNVEISDVGILHLYMKHAQTDERWELEFNLRAKRQDNQLRDTK